MKLHKFTRSLLLLSLGITACAQAQTLSMEVWKSPTCGCCNEWISYMQKNGFEIKVNETGNMLISALTLNMNMLLATQP
ncbi:hypothetical protein OR617_10860 [Pasteurella multocida]|uniref:hypothetical protein n=1 Tax=Pasteurella multocida TaxID=747 RepID=UPI002260BA18|nr:hypothetical protein OR617_10860 [Pasteurella multocida]